MWKLPRQEKKDKKELEVEAREELHEEEEDSEEEVHSEEDLFPEVATEVHPEEEADSEGEMTLQKKPLQKKEDPVPERLEQMKRRKTPEPLL